MKGWLRILLIILPYIFIVGIFQLIGGAIAGVDMTNLESEQDSIQKLIISFFDLSGTFLVLWLFMKFVDKEPPLPHDCIVWYKRGFIIPWFEKINTFDK